MDNPYNLSPDRLPLYLSPEDMSKLVVEFEDDDKPWTKSRLAWMVSRLINGFRVERAQVAKLNVQVRALEGRIQNLDNILTEVGERFWLI